MNFAENLIQYFFSIILLLLLSFYGLVILATKRAINQTRIPIPGIWKLTMIISFLVILGTLILIVLSHFLL